MKFIQLECGSLLPERKFREAFRKHYGIKEQRKEEKHPEFTHQSKFHK